MKRILFYVITAFCSSFIAAQGSEPLDDLSEIQATNVHTIQILQQFELEFDRPYVQALSWSADGVYLAVGTQNNVFLYNTQSDVISKIDLDTNDLVFAPHDPDLLVVMTQQEEAPYLHQLVLMNLTSQTETIMDIPFVSTGAFSRDGMLFAASSSVNVIDQVVLFETETWTEVAVLQLQRDRGTHAIAFSPDRRWLATINQGGGGYLWDVQQALAQRALSIDSALPLDSVIFANALAFSTDGVLAVSSDVSTLLESDPRLDLRQVSARGGQPILRPVLSAQRSTSLTSGVSDLHIMHDLAFTLDGALLIAVTEDGQLQFWDGASGELLYNVQEEQTPILNVAVNPAGTLIATDQGEVITLWGVRQTE